MVFIIKFYIFSLSAKTPQVGGTFIAVLIVERFGRKPLLFVSAVFMAISIFALGTYFYLEEHPGKFDPETVDDLGVLPLVSLIVYIITFSIGTP